MTEVDQGEEKPRQSLIETVNEELKKLTPEDEEPITLQDIAIHLGVDTLTLYKWLNEDEEFKQGLLNYIALDKTIFYDPIFGNKADAMTLALFIMEMKKKHTK